MNIRRWLGGMVGKPVWMRGLAVAAGLLLASTAGTASAATAHYGILSTVSISASSPSVAVGAPVSLSASPFDAGGNPLLSTGDTVAAVTGSYDTTYILDTQGQVWTVGDGSQGQLGNGTYSSTSVPVLAKPVWGSGVQIVKIIAPEYSSGGYNGAVYALDSAGRVWAWGWGPNGELGDGSSANSDVPVEVTPSWGTAKIVAIGAGQVNGYAIDSLGRVWAWGAAEGLGDGASSNAYVPVPVTAPWASQPVQVAGGIGSGLVLTSDGNVWAWGNNNVGQLGNGTTNYAPTPVETTRSWGSGTSIVRIAGGNNLAYAVDSKGRAWSWGWGFNGELGNGTFSLSEVPTQVVSSWSSQASKILGHSGGLVLDSTGAVWDWGWGGYGFGNGTAAGSTNEDAPVQVTPVWGASTPATAIGEDAYSEFAVANGALWGWGADNAGQLGIGGTVGTTATTPVEVFALPITYAWTAGAGSFSSSTGRNVSWTAPHTPGTYTVTVTATQGAISATASTTVTVVAGPLASVTINPSSPTVPGESSQNFVAQGYDQYGNSIGGLAYTWSASSGTLAAASGSSNTWTAPNITGYGSATVTVSGAMSGKTVSATANVSLTPGPLTVTSLGTACVANDRCDYTLTAIGGVEPYTWSTTAPGTLDPATGQETSTAPATAGTYPSTVTVTDGSGQSASATFTLSVVPGPLHSITLTPANATVQTGGTQAFTAQGYDSYGNAITGLAYSWRASAGTFATPTGSSNTWTAQGSPGTATVMVSATQSGSTAQASASVVVTDGPLGIYATPLPGATAGTPYSATVSAYGGIQPYTWSVTSGSLPAGMSLDPSTGGISGTADAAGTSTFTVEVTDSSPTPETATRTLSITVSPGSLASVTLIPTSATLTAGGGSKTFAVTTQDAYGNSISGLSISWTGTGGTLSTASGGSTVYTPGSASGSFSVTATASQGAQTRSAAASVTILPASVASVTISPSNTAVVAGHAASFAAEARDAYGNVIPGATFVWTATGGTLSGSGTPVTYTAGATGGTYAVTVSASAGGSTKTATASVDVEPVLSITTTSLPSGVVGTAYTANVAASGGVAPYARTSSALPPGLTLNPATGTITGKPIITGSTSFVVGVTDQSLPGHQSATHTFTVSVFAPLSVQTASLPAGVQGDGYSADLVALGGETPLSWSVSGGALPLGLTLSASGQISGTASAAGGYVFTVTVTASDGQTATKSLAVQVYPPLTIGTASLTAATVGQPYSAFLAASGGNGGYVWSAVYGVPAGMGLSASGDLGGTPTVAGTYAVQVKVVDGVGDVAAQTIGVTVNPVPVSGFSITGMSPTSGPAGTKVTIDGTDLTRARVVDFGASAGTSLRAAPNGAALTIVAPAGSGAVPVTVVTITKSITAGTFTYS